MTERPEKKCETGIIYYDMLRDAYDMIEDNEDPAYVRDFLLACMETVLCEGISSEDKSIYRNVRHYFTLVDKARERYQDTCENKEVWKYENERYEDIARMAKAGNTQKQIAEAIGVSQAAISRRLKIIKEKYPHLLEEI